MFYLYDLTTYTKNYGAISPTDTDEDEKECHDLLRDPNSSSSYWSDDEDDTADDEKEEDAVESAWQSRRRRRRKRRKERLLNIDEAVQSLGMGIFQYRIALAAGMLLAADSMEVVILSYLSSVFRANNPMMMNPVAAENNVDTMNMVVFPAGVAGALVWGMLGDMIGRRKVFNGAAAMVAVFGVLTAFVNSYQWLLVTRLLVGFGIGGLTVPFCTFSEFLPPSQRGTNLICVQVFCIVGALLVHLTLQQQALDAWRKVVVFFSIPSILALALGMTVVPESPRWLLAQDRQDEALAILRVAAKANGKDPAVLFPAGTMLYSHEPQEPRNAILTLFSSAWLQLTSIISSTYFGMAFLNHGTISLAVSVFSKDHRQQDYQAVFIAGSHFLSLFVVVFLIDGFGRASTQCLSYAVGGLLCLTISLLEDCPPGSTSPNLLLVLTFLSHTCMFGGKCATWISTTEILATEMRTTGHGLANAFSRIGGVLSACVISRIYSLPSIGLALFVLSLWTASAASKLPETNVKEMGVVYYPLVSSNHIHRRRRAAACSSSAPSSGNRY